MHILKRNYIFGMSPITKLFLLTSDYLGKGQYQPSYGRGPPKAMGVGFLGSAGLIELKFYQHLQIGVGRGV